MLAILKQEKKYNMCVIYHWNIKFVFVLELRWTIIEFVTAIESVFFFSFFSFEIAALK